MTFTRSSSASASRASLRSSSALLALLLVGCSGDDPAPAPVPEDIPIRVVEEDAAIDAPPVPVDEGLEEPPPPASLADHTFEAPQPWATPLEDYLAVGLEKVGDLSFERGIQDLTVYLDRLYIAYGDATHNLGREIPIEIRYFDDPDSNVAKSEFETQEEHLERYRLIGGRAYIAGIDATEDAHLGNVYHRGPEVPWEKSRTVSGGVHVHDIVGFKGDLYAVGSGSQPDEWAAGDIYGHLWRSTDEAQSFEILHRHHNGGVGDARFTRLVPTADTLYVFGYLLNNQGIHALPNTAWDGEKATLLESGHPLYGIFASESDPIDADRTLLRGVDVTTESPRPWSTWMVSSGAQVTKIERFANETIADVAPAPDTGEWLLLTYDGNDYGTSVGGELTEWFVRFYVTRDFVQFTQLTGFYTEVPPDSVAVWKGAVYYGTAWGEVWRALPQ